MEISCSSSNQPCLGMEVTCSPTKLSVSRSSTKDQNQSNRKRRVRFALPVAITESKQSPSGDIHYLDEQNIHNLWWSRSDFDSIMSKAMSIASEARQQPIVAAGLSQAFQFAVKETSLMGSEDQLEKHLQTMQEEHRGLKLWCQYGHARRGLEKFTSRPYNEVRRKQIHKLNKRVLALSQQGAHSEDIRHVSERTSRVCVVFARMLAIADSNAAKSIHLVSNDAQSADVVGKTIQFASPVLSLKHLGSPNRASSSKKGENLMGRTK